MQKAGTLLILCGLSRREEPEKYQVHLAETSQEVEKLNKQEKC